MVVRVRSRAARREAAALGRSAGARLIAAGADRILDEVRRQTPSGPGVRPGRGSSVYFLHDRRHRRTSSARARATPRSSPCADAAVSPRPTLSSTIVWCTRDCCASRAADAERIDVGAAAPPSPQQDAISLLLAEKAREGKRVVRLKWGDPFVFDSGGKEAMFLHEQGIPFEVVPGVPALIAAPCYAGVPVTYPGAGDTLIFVRGHEDGSSRPIASTGTTLARLDGTLVCYAGPRQLAGLVESLVATAVRRTNRPRSCLHGTLPNQRTSRHAGDARAEAERSGIDKEAGHPHRRRRRRSARAPALVRRPAALRQARAGHAVARAGGRARRAARGSRRRSHRGAVDPHRAAGRLRAARLGVRRRRPLRLDRLHQCQRRRLVHAPAARRAGRRSQPEGTASLRHRSGDRRPARPLGHQGRPDAGGVSRRGDHRRDHAAAASCADGACCCRAPTSPARCWRKS